MALIKDWRFWSRLAQLLGRKMRGPRRYRQLKEITTLLKKAYRSASDREAVLGELLAEADGPPSSSQPLVVHVEEVISYPSDPVAKAMEALPADFAHGAQPRELPRSGRGKINVALQYTGPDDDLSREILGNISKGEFHIGRLANLRVVAPQTLLEFLTERLGRDNLLTEQIRASALFGFVRSGPGWYMSTRVEIN